MFPFLEFTHQPKVDFFFHIFFISDAEVGIKSNWNKRGGGTTPVREAIAGIRATEHRSVLRFGKILFGGSGLIQLVEGI